MSKRTRPWDRNPSAFGAMAESRAIHAFTGTETTRRQALTAALAWLDECERRCEYDTSDDAWCAWRGAKQAVDGLTDGARRLERQERIVGA